MNQPERKAMTARKPGRAHGPVRLTIYVTSMVPIDMGGHLMSGSDLQAMAENDPGAGHPVGLCAIGRALSVALEQVAGPLARDGWRWGAPLFGLSPAEVEPDLWAVRKEENNGTCWVSSTSRALVEYVSATGGLMFEVQSTSVTIP
jgi:hypothetical protein